MSTDANSKEMPDGVGKPTAEVSGSTLLNSPTWISGWRLYVIAFSTALALFMCQAESAITSTAVTSITDDLGGFDRSPWIFTSYLLTYGSFPILLAKVSDTLGRKQVLLFCAGLFVVFSAACGASQTLTQLIMFRWIKGIGAGGIISLCYGYGFELRSPEKWPSYSAVLTFTGAVAVCAAPLIGSGFSGTGAWRWCFLLHVPLGVTAMALMVVAMPNKLQLEPSSRLHGSKSFLQRLSLLKSLDFPGALMIVGASALLTAALQQASQGTSFISPQVLVLLILSPLFILGFVAWQWAIDKYLTKLNPIMSWKLLTNRPFMLALCNAWLSGIMLINMVVQIPQRYMLANGLSAIDAGVRLLPFASTMSFTAIIISMLMGKTGIPAVYTLLFGALLEIGGTTGLALQPLDASIHDSQYAFQMLAGVGVGIFNIILLLLTPFSVEREHLAVGNGAINQFRVLGGSYGLAIITCITVPKQRHWLEEILTPELTSLILDRTDQIKTLAPEAQVMVRKSFARLYNMQSLILVVVASLQFVVALLQWQKKQIILKK